jgi:hypothetical protein
VQQHWCSHDPHLNVTTNYSPLMYSRSPVPCGRSTRAAMRVPQRTARAHRAHRALRQTRHLPVKCTPFSDRCFVKCYSKMFGSHCNVWFPMLCFQAVSKCLVSTAMFVSQCFVFSLLKIPKTNIALQ